METNKPNQICKLFGADRTPMNRSTLETNSIETKALNINVDGFVNPKIKINKNKSRRNIKDITIYLIQRR